MPHVGAYITTCVHQQDPSATRTFAKMSIANHSEFKNRVYLGYRLYLDCV